MDTAAALNRRFGNDSTIGFHENDNGFVTITVDNPLASATIALQGAHLMHFQPKGEEALIWMSPEAKQAEGKSIRGGVPICWPWFGSHADNASLPAHGFARTVPWRLNLVQTLPGGATKLEFELDRVAVLKAGWPQPCTVRHLITIGKSLQHELITTNLDNRPMPLSEALHTYFRLGDVRHTSVSGLSGCDYLDKVRDFERDTQTGPVRFHGEVDRIYLDTPAMTEIRDTVMKRRIVIRSSGSRSTVVWNPWIEKAAQMGDLGPEGYRNMLCVETANAATDSITLAPGAQHRLVARYTIEAL